QAEADKAAAPLTAASVGRAWAPYALMSVFLMASGLIRQQESRGPVHFGPVRTDYVIPVTGLHEQVARAERLRKDPSALETEKAEYHFAWLTSPGSPVLVAALVSMVMLGM